jgi:hypothetical protein
LKKNNDKTSEGLNQIFEIINAKGDTGELEEIVESSEANATKDVDQ